MPSGTSRRLSAATAELEELERMINSGGGGAGSAAGAKRLEAGDHVRVVVDGRDTGVTGVVIDAQQSGEVKIRSGNAVKKYAAAELELAPDLGGSQRQI